MHLPRQNRASQTCPKEEKSTFLAQAKLPGQTATYRTGLSQTLCRKQTSRQPLQQGRLTCCTMTMLEAHLLLMVTLREVARHPVRIKLRQAI